MLSNGKCRVSNVKCQMLGGSGGSVALWVVKAQALLAGVRCSVAGGNVACGRCCGVGGGKIGKNREEIFLLKKKKKILIEKILIGKNSN